VPYSQTSSSCELKVPFDPAQSKPIIRSFVARAGVDYCLGTSIENYSGTRSDVVVGLARYVAGELLDVIGETGATLPCNATHGDMIVFYRQPATWVQKAQKLGKKCLAALPLLLLLTGCGGAASAPSTPSAGSDPAQQSTQGMPAQPVPVGSAQFSMFGFTWQMYGGNAPGGGTFSKANVDVQANQIVLTLDEDGSGDSTGAEIATLTPFGYGTYTFTYLQDVVQSGSIAAGFSYLSGSVTEIDVEQQGQYPQRWDFTNWLTTLHKDTSFVEGYPANEPHTIEYVWTPSQITWYMDGQQVAQHHEYIPSTPAPFLLNFWGTNSRNWGGLATKGTRHMIITGFNYQPAQ
jgi:beta-glucanase (GH16 family)